MQFLLLLSVVVLCTSSSELPDSSSCASPTALPSTTQDVILASVHKTSDPLCYCKPLISSWKRLNSQSRLVLFIQDIYMNSSNKKYIEFLQYLNDNNVEIQVNSYNNYGLLMARFHYFFKYISRNYPQINRVLMVDARDVLFWEDPFPFISHHQFFLVYEGCNGDHTYRNTKGSNRIWLKKLFGYPLVKQYKHKNKGIANCGVMGGGKRNVHKVLKSMIRTHETFGKRGDSYGNDMAIINYLFHSGTFKKLKVDVEAKTMTNSGFGVVMCDHWSFNGRPLMSNNCPLTLLHQWQNNQKGASQIEEYIDYC
ncbi:hypothetical protein P9112_004671 [Eukaryota sp. TZLM1-RC]